MTDSGVQLHWLTHYTAGDGNNVQSPRLVRINSNRFLVLWMENRESSPGIYVRSTYCVFIDAKGEATSQTYRYEGIRLSNCDPVLSGDRVVWYYTDSSTPTFYAIDLNHPDQILRW